MVDTQGAREMTLEEFASISAALEAGLPRDAILVEAGFSPGAWEAAQERWLATLAGEAAQGRLRPGKRYVELVGAEKPAAAARARKVRRRLAGQLPVPPAPPLAPRLTTASEKVLPTAMLEAEAPKPVAYVAPNPAPAPAAPSPTQPPARRARLDATVALSIAALMQQPKALPFAAPESGREGDEPPASRIPRVDGTLPLAVSAGATLRAQPSPLRATGGLPFATATVASEGDTSPAQPSPLHASSGLPFTSPTPGSGGEAPPPRPSPPREAWGLPFQRASAPEPPAPPPVAASPVVPASALGEHFSLAEYAHLCAGVRAHPTHVPWIQSQYGLSPETWTALHALWQQRFARDPALKAKWQRLIAERVPYWKRERG